MVGTWRAMAPGVSTTPPAVRKVGLEGYGAVIEPGFFQSEIPSFLFGYRQVTLKVWLAVRVP